MDPDELMQIGEVAGRTGLSLRTIRYYEEVGLAVPSARSAGGFRLYTQDNVTRLRVIMRMKPLGFSLEDMRDLLEVLDGLAAGEPSTPELRVLLARLTEHLAVVDERVESMRSTLEEADRFATELRATARRHTPPTDA